MLVRRTFKYVDRLRAKSEKRDIKRTRKFRRSAHAARVLVSHDHGPKVGPRIPEWWLYSGSEFASGSASQIGERVRWPTDCDQRRPSSWSCTHCIVRHSTSCPVHLPGTATSISPWCHAPHSPQLQYHSPPTNSQTPFQLLLISHQRKLCSTRIEIRPTAFDL